MQFRALRHVSLFLAAALSILAATTATANTYYISPAGSDTNPGTSAAPWRSIQKASASLQPGDTAMIADGDYAGGITQSRSGTSTAPITFKAVNAGMPVVHGDPT